MLRAAVEGIQARGGASLGDKTLLDALVPAIDRLEADLAAGGAEALANAAAVAERAAAETPGCWQTRPGFLYRRAQHWLSRSGCGGDRSDCQPRKRRLARV